MALTTTNSYVLYEGTGSQTAFTFPYKFTRRTDLRVTLIDGSTETDLTLGPDYSVDPDGGDTGTVTLTSAPAAGVQIRIQRVVALTQPESFPIQGPFDTKAVERLMDRVYMALQQLSDGVGIHFHGIEPGGNLHALASDLAHGFMSRQDWSWIREHQGSGTAHTIDQIDELREVIDELENLISARAPVAHEHPIAAVEGLQPELDAITIELDSKEAKGADVAWSRVTGTPTTVGDYGITDAYTKTETNNLVAVKANADDVYDKLSVDDLLAAKADGADVYQKTEVDDLLVSKADLDAVYTKTETNNLVAVKADKASTLAGYGITDAYTKQAADNLLADKAEKALTYTKAEVDNLLANISVPMVRRARYSTADGTVYVAEFGDAMFDEATLSPAGELLVPWSDPTEGAIFLTVGETKEGGMVTHRLIGAEAREALFQLSMEIANDYPIFFDILIVGWP